MPRKRKNPGGEISLIEGEIPLFIGYNRYFVGRARAVRNDDGTHELSIILNADTAEGILRIMGDNLPFALSFDMVPDKPKS